MFKKFKKWVRGIVIEIVREEAIKYAQENIRVVACRVIGEMVRPYYNSFEERLDWGEDRYTDEYKQKNRTKDEIEVDELIISISQNIQQTIRNSVTQEIHNAHISEEAVQQLIKRANALQLVTPK